MKYVQIGEKKNGRFVKSEIYTLDEFRTYINRCRLMYTPPVFNWVDKIIGKVKRHTNKSMMIYNHCTDLLDNIIATINYSIDSDKKGKKVKKL